MPRAPRVAGAPVGPWALVALALLAIAAVALLSRGGDDAPPARSGSTLAGTYADPDRNGVLEGAAGEQLVGRTELAPSAAPVRTLATLAQISDAHVRDEESPARAVLLDRLGAPFTPTFRPQEALSTQVLAASVESVNRMGPDAVFVTGDLIDSAQSNELEQAVVVLNGGRVRPDTGATGYDGPQLAASADPFVYRPDLDAPRHPGLLDAAQQSFTSPGLDAPWYVAPGNHDLLVQGEAPPSPSVGDLAVGGRALTGIDPEVEVPDAFSPGLVEEVLGDGLPGETSPVAPDPRRRHVDPAEALARLTRAGASRAEQPGRLDHSFDVGAKLRVVVLDLVRRDGGSDGQVLPEQARWLREELARAGERWVIVASHQPLASSEGGEAALAELDASPRVIAAVSGHTHDSSIEPRRSPAGGYWLIGTASLADFPQQARALKLVETEGGGVALETWMLDTAADPLADTARDLAFLDAQGGRPDGSAGERGDRNARLYR